jgi:hypothetical protein
MLARRANAYRALSGMKWETEPVRAPGAILPSQRALDSRSSVGENSPNAIALSRAGPRPARSLTHNLALVALGVAPHPSRRLYCAPASMSMHSHHGSVEEMMRVVIATDLEGISGVCVWEQTRDRTSALYQDARRLLIGDISAAVEGCLAGGATEILVVDGHGGGFNIVPELLHPRARCFTGRGRRPFMSWGHIFEGLDAAILLGCHAMAGTAAGILRLRSSPSGPRAPTSGPLRPASRARSRCSPSEPGRALLGPVKESRPASISRSASH